MRHEFKRVTYLCVIFFIFRFLCRITNDRRFRCRTSSDEVRFGTFAFGVHRRRERRHRHVEESGHKRFGARRREVFPREAGQHRFSRLINLIIIIIIKDLYANSNIPL